MVLDNTQKRKRGKLMAAVSKIFLHAEKVYANGRPILKLPDRRENPGIPSGWVNVLANDQPYVANFVKEFVNVVRTDPQSETNVLADIIRGWFGADAGRPGTRYEVAFEPADDAFRMRPVVIHQAN